MDLGPFKHKIDDGLELRKAAFECMDVLLERCKDRINMGQFITHLEQGLQVSALRRLAGHACIHSCMSDDACIATCIHVCKHSSFGCLCNQAHVPAVLCFPVLHQDHCFSSLVL